MEKIYYTSCAKSVFSREAGRQIYTCSRGLNFQVRQIADDYIKMLVMSASSQVRNIYSKHEDLGYVYAQIKSGGSDAAGRQNNEFCQLILDVGENSVFPIEVFLRSDVFIDGLSREQIEGRVEPAFLPQFPPLAATEMKWSQLDTQKDNNRWQTICELVDALIECKKNDKKLIICDKNTKMITAWIFYLSMCLPYSMMKDVTFDTYTPNPFKAKERILGVCATAGKSVVEEYGNDGKFIVFDLVNKQSNHKISNLYTEQMASWQQNVGKNMQNLIELYHQEQAGLSDGESTYEYMNDIAKIHAFLYSDAAPLFATNDALNERALFIEYGKTFRKYHSNELKENVYCRFEKIIGESGKPETFIELKQILSDELYQQDRARIDEICYRAIGDVLNTHGAKKAYEFFERATAKGTKDNRTELAKKLIELVLENIQQHFSKVEESELNGTLKHFVLLLAEVGTKEQKEQTIEWINAYFKENYKRLDIDFFRSRDEYLFKYLNDVDEKLMEKTYTNMINYVVQCQTVKAEYINVLRERNQTFLKAGNDKWTYKTVDVYVEYFVGRYNAQKDVIGPLKIILKQFVEKTEAKYLNAKLREELPQCLKKLEDSLAESYYKQYETELSVGFKTLKEENEGLIIPLFNYALRHGKDRASVVIEWVKADVGDRSLVINALDGSYPEVGAKTGAPDYLSDTMPQLIKLVKKEKKKVRLPLIKAFTEEFVAYSIAEQRVDKNIIGFLYKFRNKIDALASPDGILLLTFAMAHGSKKIEKCMKEVISSYRVPNMALKPLLETLAKRNGIALKGEDADQEKEIEYCFNLLFKTETEREEMRQAEAERKKQEKLDEQKRREEEEERKRNLRQAQATEKKAKKEETAKGKKVRKPMNAENEEPEKLSQPKGKSAPDVENPTILTPEQRKELKAQAKNKGGAAKSTVKSAPKIPVTNSQDLNDEAKKEQKAGNGAQNPSKHSKGLTGEPNAEGKAKGVAQNPTGKPKVSNVTPKEETKAETQATEPAATPETDEATIVAEENKNQKKQDE